MQLLQSMAIGLAIAAPVGPIGLLCIERSLKHGFATGLATGLGAASADAVFGLLGALGVSSLVLAFPRQVALMQAAGGLLLVLMALATLKSRPATEAAGDGGGQRAFVSTFLLTLSNPMTIISFAAIFSALGTRGGPGEAGTALMVGGIFAGSACWWLFLSAAAALLKRRLGPGQGVVISAVSAAIIAAIGIVQVVDGLAAYGLLRAA